MKIRSTTKEKQKVFKVFDAAGNPIDCIEYDTATQEVTMEIAVRSKWAAHFNPASLQHQTKEGPQPVVLQFKVAGSYAVDEEGNRVS